MRIAYLITRADPIGGAQIHVRDLAGAARRLGHSATVITSGSGPFLDELRNQGTPTILLRHLGVPIRPLRDVRAYHEIRATLEELRPDLIAAHSSKAGTLGRLVGRSLGVPVVFTVHGWAFTPGVPGLSAWMYRRIERAVAPLASRIITVSEFDRRLALEARIAPPDRVAAVHNGMADVPPSLRAEPGGAPPRLVMVARFGDQKDHPTLLRALAGLREQPWQLDLVGEGALLAQTRALAESLGLADRVRFLGQRMDVDRILARSQVALLVSNWEGFPLSILEAMRAGLPVVASEVGGVAEAIRDGESGYLVPRADVAQLRDRIGRLLRSPELRSRLGAGGRAVFEQEFTLARCVARTLAVYAEAIGGAERARRSA
ncbi:MAG TPA: glycosyltransferase family 4 protein [Gemmatimonadales bacterium]